MPKDKYIVKCDNPGCYNFVSVDHGNTYLNHFCSNKCHGIWMKITGSSPMKRPEVRAKIMGILNCAHRPEVRRKHSIYMKEHAPSKRPEVAKKISEANAGRIHEISIETINKISNTLMGHTVSDASNEKNRMAHVNNKHDKFGTITEVLLCTVFKEVIKMPHGNPGFDFYCMNKFKIDAKASFPHKNNWIFYTNKNVIPDYFAFVAYSEMEDHNNFDNLIPEHFWLVPESVVRGKNRCTIRNTSKSIERWLKYERDINELINVCISLQNHAYD